MGCQDQGTLLPSPVRLRQQDDTDSQDHHISVLSALTIKTTTTATATTTAITGSSASASGGEDQSLPISPAISISPHLYSPATISPPSSAFVSALQSPYISPRAFEPEPELLPTVPLPPSPVHPPPCTLPTQLGIPPPHHSSSTTATATTATTTTTTATTTPTTLPSPICYSDDVPSTSHTPPSDRYDLSTDPLSDPQQPHPIPVPKLSSASRISFSFPVPRVSLTRPSVSPSPASASANAKLRSCDVYIGYHGQGPSLARFCRWLRAELELQGVASFVADRAKYANAQSHDIADRIICSAAVGVVVVSPSSLINPHTIEEVRFFAQKRNLVPLLFDTNVEELAGLVAARRAGSTAEDGCRDIKDAFDGLSRCHDMQRLEANDANWRSCIARSVDVLKTRLGRKSASGGESDEQSSSSEVPFPRNRFFVGREKELAEMEVAFFGCCDFNDIDCAATGPVSISSSTGGGGGGSTTSGAFSDGFADEESDTVRTTSNSRFISLEVRKSSTTKEREPIALEAWIDSSNTDVAAPATSSGGGSSSIKGQRLQRQRSKHRKSKHWASSAGGGGRNTNVVCVAGPSGVGKTELALEYAHRYTQRYKAVLWVNGEARYLRQSVLNLAAKLGLDVSAEAERERGRIRGFDEQELDAFQRVKRELFRDVPYLLVIDNLESEKEWWEGKDLHDLIPSNTGATNVVVTTRLPRVMSFDPIQLQPLSLADSLLLIKGRRKKSYPDTEMEVLKKMDEKLGRLSFGLWLVGSLLSELEVLPSELFEAIDKISLGDSPLSLNSAIRDDGHPRVYQHPDNSSSFSASYSSFLMKVLGFCFAILDQPSGKRSLAFRMALAGAWFAPTPVSSTLLASAANKIPAKGSRFVRWKKCLGMALCCCSRCCVESQARRGEVDSANLLVKLGLARRATTTTTNKKQKQKQQHGGGCCWIQFHPITQRFAQWRGGMAPAMAAVLCMRKVVTDLEVHSDHLWASTFLVFGFKSEPPPVQLMAVDMVAFIKRTALPLAIRSFMAYSRCSSALELLKVCTNVLEEAEKSFVSQIHDWRNVGPLCWKKKKLGSGQTVDELVWRDVTLLKAALLETRAKLLLRGGHFDSGEELCRTCISIRTVMLGHNHAQTLAAQETLSKLVRYRSKI